MKPPTYEGTKALSARVNEPEASHQTERYRVGGGPLTHDLLAVPHRDARTAPPPLAGLLRARGAGPE